MQNLNTDAISAVYLFVKEYFDKSGDMRISMPPHFSLYTISSDTEESISLQLEKPSVVAHLDPEHWGEWANFCLSTSTTATGAVFWAVVNLSKVSTPNPHALIVFCQKDTPAFCMYNTLDFSMPPQFLRVEDVFSESAFQDFDLAEVVSQ